MKKRRVSLDDKYAKMDNLKHLGKVAVLQPGDYYISEHQIQLTVSVSEHYSKITINGVEVLFVRETGEYDGWTKKTGPDGPVLAFTSSAVE